MKPRLYKYVLVEDIANHERDGWTLGDKRLALTLGGWPSVLMWQEV